MPEQRPAPKDQPTGVQPRLIGFLLLMFLAWYVVGLLQQDHARPDQVSYSDFLQAVDAGRVAEVDITGLEVSGRYRGEGTAEKPATFHTTLPRFTGQDLLQTLRTNGVNINVRPDQPPAWLQLITGLLPWVFFFALFMYFSNSLRARMGRGLFGFTASRARRFEKSAAGPTFNDIAGLEGAKQDLQEIIEYLREPQRFRDIGARMPRGILMMGAPGTGKTLLARATANEAGVPFFSISGSEFIELYVGVGASRVRDMFLQARKEAPALIFIDEIDSVGRVRGTGLGGGNDEREQTLNQILAEMDGFRAEEVVVVLAATNRPDVLDPALMRPGRFDRKVVLELPQKQARIDILGIHSRKVPLAGDVDLATIAAATVGFSGADLQNLVNEAALRAAHERRPQVTADDFLHARDKVLMGAERHDLVTPSERRRIAVHEAGHTLVAVLSPHSDPVQKVSIVPRGRALGMTEQIPLEDRHNIDENYLHERLRILLAGRASEQLEYGTTSTGAADDLKEATSLCRRMVANWGMSPALGPVGYRDHEEHPFLGREITEARDFSDATARLIDEEVRKLLQRAEQSVLETLAAHRDALARLVAELLEHESLDRTAIDAAIAGAA